MRESPKRFSRSRRSRPQLKTAQPAAARRGGGVDFEIFSQNTGTLYRWIFGTPDTDARQPVAHDLPIFPQNTGKIYRWVVDTPDPDARKSVAHELPTFPMLASMKPCVLASAQPDCGEQSLK